MASVIVKIFATILRRKLIIKEDGTKEVKWYQSETILAGIVVGIHGAYTLAKFLGEAYFGFTLPPVPDEITAAAGTLLGGTIVWGRWTAEAKVVK